MRLSIAAVALIAIVSGSSAFAETVEVLVKKLAQAREEAVADFRRRERPVATDGGFTVADRPAVQGNPPLPTPGDFTRQ